MDQKQNNRKEENGNLNESSEHFDATNGKDTKNVEEKMQKLETESAEQPKMEGQMESEKCNEAKKEEDFFVPNWLIEVLEWIKRMEMAESKLSTSSWAFNELCGPKLHGKNVKPHMLGRMELNGTWDFDSGNIRAIARYGGQPLPIPSTPPPDYILGFKHIHVLFFDNRVLEFIKCIASKLDGIKFFLRIFYDWKLNEQNERKKAIECLLNALAERIDVIDFLCHDDFKNLSRHFPQFINQCQCICIDDSSPKFQKPEFDALFEWLTNRQQMDGGKQKILLMFIPNVKFDYFYERIKEEFSNATEPHNFLIYLFGSLHSAEYGIDLENENTGEVLNSYQSKEFPGTLILRCPKDQEERWKKEGEKKIKMLTTSDDVTVFELDIRKFGVFTDLAKNEQE